MDDRLRLNEDRADNQWQELTGMNFECGRLPARHIHGYYSVSARPPAGGFPPMLHLSRHL